MQSSRRVSCIIVLVKLLTVVSSLLLIRSVAPVQAQIFRVPDMGSPQEKENEGDRLHTERRIEAKLTQMSAAARKNDSAEVMEHLESLRAADPMLMIRESDDIYIPLHRALVTRIQGYKPEIREAIQKADLNADAALQKALRTESSEGLSRFIQQFAGTKAALKAHLLLASIHTDRGHNLVAQFWLAPLLTSQADPELKALAEKLKTRLTSSGETALAESRNSGPQGLKEEVPASKSSSKSKAGAVPESTPADDGSNKENNRERSDSSDSEPPAETPLGQQSEAAVRSPDQKDPLSEAAETSSATVETGDTEVRYIEQRHWYKSLPVAAAARTRSQQLLRESKAIKAIPWSAWQPEVDTQRIYVRAPGLLSAYQLSSGQHLWTRSLTSEQLLARAPEPDYASVSFGIERDPIREAMNSPEILSLHRNEMMGRMTSDAERLFVVSQLNAGYGPGISRGMIRMRGDASQVSAGLWELAAYDKSTGRRLWTMGGPPVEEKFGNELAMAWLAGPPTVDRDNLYQVVEQDSAVQLVCLDTVTGRLRWRVPLSYPEYQVGLDAARQLLSAQMTVRDGVIYTTSTTGWVFALDKVTRSMIWARRLKTNTQQTRQQRMMRNSGMFVSDVASLGETWRSQPPILLGDRLVIPTAESGQLLCVDATSGKTRSSSVSPSGTTVVLHCDPEWLIVASPASVIGFSSSNLKKVWMLKISDSVSSPVGPASRQGDNLYVPLADGSAAVVSLSDGTLKQTLKRFRPAWSSGGLYSTPAGILSYAPDHLTILSLEPPQGHDETDPLQHALFLFESGDLKEAANAAAKIPITALRRDAVRRLKFRIAVAMLKADSGDQSPTDPKDLISREANQLEEIAGMAQTAQEKTLTHFLRLDFLLRTARENVVPSLIDALMLDESVQMVDVPVTSSLKELLADASGIDPLARNPLKPSKEQRFVTFRAWVLMQLRKRIENADLKERSNIILAMASVPDAVVLEMHSKDLAEDLLRRAEAQLEKGECNELTLQLLMSAADAQLDSGSADNEQRIKTSLRIAENFGKTRELLSGATNAESAHRELVDRLLIVAQYELQGQQPGLTVAAPDDIRKLVTDRAASTPELPLTMLPVSIGGRLIGRSSRRSEINLYSASDPALSAFRWSARSLPGAIQATSVRDPFLAAWGLSRESIGNQGELRNFELYRFGTVLLLVDSESLSAFSVTEQRWLWKRNSAAGFSSRRAGLSDRNFAKLDTGVGFLMMSFPGYGLSICGGNARWVCLRTQDSVEVVDVYSGNRLWGMPLEDSLNSVLAYRTAIIGHKGYGDVVRLNPIDGREQEPPPSGVSIFSSMQILRETPDSILTMKYLTMNGDQTLQWVDPQDGVVKRKVELTSNMYVSLADAETLAILTEGGDLRVVNLITGSPQDFPGSAAEISKALSVPSSRLAFFMDDMNYYVYEAEENGIGLLSFETSRLIPVKKCVMAFSRNTGKLAWVHPLKEAASLYVDGPDEVVLILEGTVNANGGAGRVFNIPGLGIQMGQVYQINGLSRNTGLSRFEYRVSAQRPIPEVRLTKTTPDQLDLEAFGNRIRYISSPAVAAP
jgi:outer membrane protein assembly factor BamB